MEIPEKNSLDRFIKWKWHEKDLLNMKWYQQIIHSEKLWGKKKSEETWMIQDIYRRTFKKITCFGIMEEECKKRKKNHLKLWKKWKM